MDQDRQQRIENLQQKYFSHLQKRISQMVSHENQKIATLLYTVIFDDSYYEIIKVYNYSEQELNNQIAKTIFIPLSEIELNNTQQLIQVIPWFLLFVIGQNLDINKCINLDNENEWGMFLTFVAQKCNYDPSAQEYFGKLQNTLINKFKQVQFTTLEEVVNLIVSTQKLLELLNQMFYWDYYPFAISQTQTQDIFYDLKLQKRQQIITNSYQFLSQRDRGMIQSSIEDSKMKVAISFIEKNYNYGYLTETFHNELAGIVIFGLIQLDHKQFQNFFYSKRPSVQESLLNQIMDLSDIQDNLFLKLLLVGKCLSKLRLWEYALKFYKKLQNQTKYHQNREKYSIYITFKICKIKFLQGEIDGLQKKLKNLGIQILRHQNQGINFYQPKNRQIYHQCIFLQLLMSVYKNSSKLRTYIKGQIAPIILQSNSSNQKRYFTLLQYQFWKLADQQEIIFKDNEGKKQLEFILNKTESICQERQDIKRKSSNFFSNITSIFNSPKDRLYQCIEIKSYYRAVEEMLIINALVRHRDICVLQYLNLNLYPLLRVLLAQKNFFALNLKPQLYIFIHDFEEAFKLALQTKNHEIMAQILDYQGKIEEAIEAYTQLSSSNSKLNCAILIKTQEDQMIQNKSVLLGNFEKQSLHENSINYFKEIAKNKEQYQIANKYLQNLQPLPSELTKSEKFSRKSSNLSESELFTDFTQQDEYFKSKLKLNLPIRQDIKLFYSVLKFKLRWEQDSQLLQLLDEFVKKTHFLKCEIYELINNNDLEQQKIGQGGNGQIYKFNFQCQSYAAKVISFDFKDSEDSMTDDEKSRLENILQEICILCDNTVSKIKYCLKIEQLGLYFEELGQQKIIKIFLVTKVYNNNQVVKDWGEEDKMKFIYKLSLGLAALQFERRLLHLDLKPENVLVDSKNNPVIIDFGLSKYSYKSQYLGDRSNQMSISYRDPELINSNYQSRKNDVYSFGVSLFYYFSGFTPFQGFDPYQIIGGNEQFYVHHLAAIQNIQNEIIKDLIRDCTQPIAIRISFVLVLKRLFLYQYQIRNPKVRNLIEMLFNQIEYNKDKEQMKPIQTFLKVMKQFIKYTNNFQSKKLENVCQRYEIISHKASCESFIEIISRMKQFINWVILNEQDFVMKLVDFELNCEQIDQSVMHITFNFWVENAQKIQSTGMILWNPFYLSIAQILKQIHAHQIYLQQIPLEFIYLKDGKVKLNCFEYSLNLKFVHPQLDSDFEQLQNFISKQDVQVLCELIGQTMEFMRNKLDQDMQDRVTQFQQILNQSEGISLEEIIGKLQN
ncbi:unnamed protein product (macronuclear) [Paramecium tetraurelia]|uniref:Protein kinase domain-containing protein n=1 Tax=Paramecium tetraurelia TaxID=5888 RepID=A0CCC4_PARTE|nr:uncharacterized protein GSPATT00037226001 [Paramecium tetraurelia]CAK68441.1 unnamed protein product [Paramecium tetraurelia]|eukprot:XP_001435838.1 hypothetical protein (macronuclear) [Paramecium tetraurelia strain d4-2]